MNCWAYDLVANKLVLQPDGVSNVYSKKRIMICRLRVGRDAGCPLCHLLADAFEAWWPQGRISHEDQQKGQPDVLGDAMICYLPDGGLRVLQLDDGYWWNVTVYPHSGTSFPCFP